jgi:hypothetical protein
MIIVQAKAPLDASFSDIGLQVGNGEFILTDRIFEDRAVLFVSNYAKIIEQFKKWDRKPKENPDVSKRGVKRTKKGTHKIQENEQTEDATVRLQLRFWPAWPVTGTHSVALRLEGFNQAYEEMLACQ